MGNLIFISCSLSISRHSWRRRSRTCHGKWREQTLMREESRALTIEGWEMEQRLEEVVTLEFISISLFLFLSLSLQDLENQMHIAEQKRRTLLKDFHDTWTSVHRVHVKFALLSTVLPPSLQRYPSTFLSKLYTASQNILSICFSHL